MNILSICGGGVRGLIPLYVLKNIEIKYNKRICDIFDYYAGSSIGAIVIAGLLLSDDGINPKYSCDELYGIIESMCKKVFSNTFYYRLTTLYGWTGAKYSIEKFEEILKDFFKDTKIKDLLKPVCFPSFDGIKHRPIYFTKEKYGDVLVRDIMRAVTAAPTYFDPKEIVIEGEKICCSETCEYNSEVYKMYDSAIVVNNPCLIAQLHATSQMEIIDKTTIYHLCLGTGESKTINPSSYGTWGWINSIIGFLFIGFNKNEVEGLYLSLMDDHIKIVEVEIECKYNILDNASDEYIKYYNDKVVKWLKDNEKNFYEFMDKLAENNDIRNSLYNLI